MSPDDERARHLRAYATLVAPPPQRRERNLEALRRRLERASCPAPVLDRRLSAKRRVAVVAIAASFAIAAAALLVLWVGATAVRALGEAARPTVLHEAPATSRADGPERTSTIRSASTTNGPSTTAQATAEPAGARERSAPAAAPRSTRAHRDEPRDDGMGSGDVAAAEDRLRDELALLRAARAALQREDFEDAWRLTGRHEVAYPDGALAHERQAWRAIAACRLERADAAERLEAFTRGHAGSPYLARVRAACRDAPVP